MPVRELVAALALILLAPSSWGAEAATSVSSPALEREVAVIASELRCLVCQNQSIADSNAPLAVDLRNQIREQLSQGRSEREIRTYMVERYGDFVLYRPPVKSSTLLLWLGPLLLLAIGLILLCRRIMRRSSRQETLSTAERERAAALLGTGEPDR
jgi:cytochrome c-type biogenesis protein CcmH